MRVLVLVHEDLVPPPTFDGMTDEEINEVRTEDDVVVALEELGHDVKVLGLYDELAPLRRTIESFRPHVVFNLLEEFHGSVVFDYHVVAYLELCGRFWERGRPRLATWQAELARGSRPDFGASLRY